MRVMLKMIWTCVNEVKWEKITLLNQFQRTSFFCVLMFFPFMRGQNNSVLFLFCTHTTLHVRSILFTYLFQFICKLSSFVSALLWTVSFFVHVNYHFTIALHFWIWKLYLFLDWMNLWKWVFEEFRFFLYWNQRKIICHFVT